MPLRAFLIALGLALSLTGSASAQTYTWNLTTSGNWNVAGNWLDEGNNPAVPTSSTTTALVFGASGATNYTATNDIGPFTLNSLTINHTGTGTITITGPAANTFTFAGTDPSINVTGTALFTGLMAGSATITKTGTGTFIHDSDNAGFTGTVIINGGTFINRATTNAVSNFNPVAIIVNDGGTYQFGSNTTGDPNLPNATYITVNAGGTVNWQEGETTGGINLQGGTINLQQGSVTTATATGSPNVQAWTSGTLTGGAFAIAGALPINKTTSGTVTISGSASITTSGGLNILDGSVVATAAANLGTSPIRFGATDGTTAGTFEYQGATASRAGAITLNAGGGTINVTNSAATLTLSGALSGAGNLTKNGPGSLTLTGALNQTGLMTVNAGGLRVNAVTSGGGFAMADGTTLAINSGAGSASFTTPSLSLGTGGTTLRFDLAASGTPTAPLANVSNTDGLNLNGGTHTVRVSNSQPFTAGTFTLIDYAGAPITSGFNLQFAGRTSGSLSYDTANTRIDVTITETGAVKWTGAVNNTWDLGSAPDVGGTNNWKLATAGTATNFVNGDVVVFDDTATGFAVNLSTNVEPFSVLFDNAANTYTLSGSGSIAGATALRKQGAGTVILANANTYTGGTTIAGGSLQLGDGGTSGSIAGAVALSGSGTLAFNRSDAVTFSNAITVSGGSTGLANNGAGAITLGTALSLGTNGFRFDGSGNVNLTTPITGSGTITKNGNGTIFFLANHNTFTGTVVINAGTVTLDDQGGGGDLGALSIVVNNGAKFTFGPSGNPDLPAGTIITLNTGGVSEWRVGEDYGGIALRGGAYNTRVNHNLGLTSTFESGTLGGVDGGFGSLAGAGLIQKTTAGTVTITGIALNNTGGIRIDEGVMSTDGVIATGAGGTDVLTLGTTASGTLQYRGGNATMGKPITLAANGGVIDVSQAGTIYTLSGAITGAGNFTKTGLGALNLTGALSHSGTTTAGAGVLRVNPATLTGGLAVSTGGTLAINSGTGATALTAPTLSLASGGGGTLRFELTGTSPPTSPLLVVSNTDGLNLNGGTHTLAVTNPAGFANGSFTLIDYNGAPINSGFGVSFSGRTLGSLTYDTVNTQIGVTITGSDTIKWTGAVNGNWDVGSAADVGGTNNWRLVTGGTATNFIQTDSISFDDTASIFTVNLLANVEPSSVTVNNTSNYTFQGSGKITGVTGLTKQGTGTLVLLTDNDYSGATTISAGTVQLGNGGTTGAITGNISIAAGATLAVNRSSNLTYTSLLSGAGDLIKTGSGTLMLVANNNPFTGTLTINGGTVRVADLGAGGDLGAASIIINNGGKFEFAGPAGNPDLPAGTMITINSGGIAEFTEAEDYGGIILRGGAYNTSDNHNFTADITSILESGTISGLPGGAGGSLAGAGIIQKTTSGTVTITGVALNNTGGLNIDEGVLSTDSAIGGSGPINFGLNGNATLQYRGTNATISRDISTGEGGVTFDVTQATTAYTLSGNISGFGGVTKVGLGTLVLGGSNIYDSGTTISAGKLLANNTAGSATGNGNVTVANGGTLGGTGTITPTGSNSVTVQNGGTITAGAAAGAGNTTLTIGANGLNLNTGGIYQVKLFGTGATDISLLNVTGNVTIGAGSLLKLDLSALSSADVNALRSSVGLGNTRTYTVITGTGTVGNFSPANFSISDLGSFAVEEWMLVSSPTTGTVQITFAPVPEPATVLGIAVAALGLGGFIRRRLRKPPEVTIAA